MSVKTPANTGTSLEWPQEGADAKGVKLSLRFFAGLVGFSLFLGSVDAAADWSQVKVGMSGAEVVRLLGEPLLRLKGRGVERWTYDGAGEVIFYDGPVRFWTAASPSAQSEAKPIESDVMFRPARPLRLLTTQTPAPTYNEPWASDGSRFRYR